MKEKIPDDLHRCSTFPSLTRKNCSSWMLPHVTSAQANHVTRKRSFPAKFVLPGKKQAAVGGSISWWNLCENVWFWRAPGVLQRCIWFWGANRWKRSKPNQCQEEIQGIYSRIPWGNIQLSIPVNKMALVTVAWSIKLSSFWWQTNAIMRWNGNLYT